MRCSVLLSLGAMLSDSPLMSNSASKTSLFVPRHVFHVFYSVWFETTLAPVVSVFRREPSAQSGSSSGPSMCHITYLAASSLSLVKDVLVLCNSASSTESVFSVPGCVDICASCECSSYPLS